MVLHERGKGHERKQAHDAQRDFRVAARRNKLLGLWVAKRMGLTGEAAAAYAKEVVAADLDEPGEEDLVRKVMKDARERGLRLREARLRQKMTELFEKARKQVAAEGS